MFCGDVGHTLHSASRVTHDFNYTIQEPRIVQYSVTVMYAHYNAGSGVKVGNRAYVDTALFFLLRITHVTSSRNLTPFAELLE